MNNVKETMDERIKRIFMEELSTYPLELQKLFLNKDYNLSIKKSDDFYEIIFLDDHQHVKYYIDNKLNGYTLEQHENWKILYKCYGNTQQGIKLSNKEDGNMFGWTQLTEYGNYGRSYFIKHEEVEFGGFDLFGYNVTESTFKSYLRQQKELTYQFLQYIMIKDLLNIVFDYLKSFCVL